MDTEPQLNPCPCCGTPDMVLGLGDYDICETCGWEDDPIQFSNPDLEGGANAKSFNQARIAWSEGKRVK
jgi:hypothetical protein